MASPRIRRMMLDYDMLQSRFAGWPWISITASGGLPPDTYRVAYAVRGLFVDSKGEVRERLGHLLEIKLSLEYPRRAPQCRMLTPVFHPNFDDASVCIGDFWAASEWLDDLVIRIGRMITYQEYNVRSPLNGLAAKWAAEHPSRLPIDDRDICPPADPAGQRSGVEATPRMRVLSDHLTATASPWGTRIVVRT